MADDDVKPVGFKAVGVGRMRLEAVWLAALCALFLLAGSSSAQTAPAVGTAAVDAAALRTIEGQVTRLRGLQPLAQPDARVLDPASLRAHLVEQLDRDYLPNEREADHKLWQALGLIGASDDLVKIQIELLSDQVVGVYDPDTKSLIVVGNTGGFGPSERLTYAHEFNHALQDQHYDLNRIAPKHHENGDRSLAVHALIEGDAVQLQALWALAHLTRDELTQLIRGGGGSDASLARAPLIVRTELLFPYIDGFNFVRSAYRQAGNDYAAVDELFRNPPESTAQILHPEKYRDRVSPVDVYLPALTSALGTDWRHIGNGVLGELDTRVLLEQWGSDRPEAARVAAGWAGDRWQLVEKDGRTALVVKSTWESGEAAHSFFGAYSSGLRTRFDASLTEESTATRQALTTPLAATDLRLLGTDVLAVIAFDRDTANAIVGAVMSSSP